MCSNLFKSNKLFTKCAVSEMKIYKACKLKKFLVANSWLLKIPGGGGYFLVYVMAVNVVNTQ